MTTTALIPTNGIHITETQHPIGYQVATYDHEGLCSAPRWFPTREHAEEWLKHRAQIIAYGK